MLPRLSPSDTVQCCIVCHHYSDVIMTTMASQITSLAVVYSIVYSGADQRKHQSSTSLAFVRGIHRDRWLPRTKGQWRGKWFHLMTSSCYIVTWLVPLLENRNTIERDKEINLCNYHLRTQFIAIDRSSLFPVIESKTQRVLISVVSSAGRITEDWIKAIAHRTYIVYIIYIQNE